jgi:site-specific DNA-methyltransferase (adenine-specific)
MNQLYYGDNLGVLRDEIGDESVDLIYLDPPFNSKRDYNLLFRSPKGLASEAQIEAFEDTWHWNQQAEREFDDLLHQSNTNVADMMRALRAFLGENDVMAYLTMMANRLLELHRVLRPRGALYLHCDPTASHYLKIVLDGVFGKENFKNEIVWHYNTGGKGKQTFLRKHDTIFWYSKTDKYVFNREAIALPRKIGTAHLRHGVDKDGREYYEDFSPRKSGKQYRWYLDQGLTPMDVWTDIQAINPSANERLGYPTQKPLALLERIITASSNRGDVVLDPFCGCGTAVDAAQKLERKWIGIDITHLAISLIEKRLKDRYKGRAKFEVHGTPEDLDAARDLAGRDKYQFQWWAVSLVDAQPWKGKKKGADTGIDGVKYFHDADKVGSRKIVVSVKGGGIKPDDVRALNHVRNRDGAEIALFISLERPTPAMKKDAAAAGLYESATGKKFPRVQLLTIDGLLDKTQRAEHPDYEPNINFKKADAEAIGEQTEFEKRFGSN